MDDVEFRVTSLESIRQEVARHLEEEETAAEKLRERMEGGGAAGISDGEMKRVSEGAREEGAKVGEIGLSMKERPRGV